MRIFKNKVTFLLILFAMALLSLFTVACTNGCSACGNYELKLSFDKEKEGHYRLRSVKSNDNTKVEIPSTYNNLPVKEIGYCAFLNCNKIKEIILPDSITHISGYAFVGCDKLKEIILPDSITYISGDAFVGCDNLRYNEKDGLRYLGTRNNPYYALMGPVENSIIHANITDECVVIAYNALYGCNNLVKVTIGSSVKHISFDLSVSNSIVEVYNKSTVDVFNESIFGSNFKNRYTPTSGQSKIVVKDGYYFYNDNEESYLLAKENVSTATELILPNDCLGNNYIINDFAFCEGKLIKNIVIPQSVIGIGKNVFNNLIKLERFNYLGTVDTWAQINFAEKEANPLTYTGKLYIQGQLVTEVNLSDGVVDIGDYAFYNYDYLTTLKTGNGVESIGKSAFFGCDGLVNVEFGANVALIEIEAFYNCYKISNFAYLGTMEQWCNIEFGHYTSNPIRTVKELKIDGEVVSELVIPDTITAIKSYAFYNCDTITSVIINSNVTSIGKSAFYSCNALETVEINANEVDYGSSAFSYCTALKNIKLSEKASAFGDSLFYNCKELLEITLPENLKQIKPKTFYNCSSLTSIILPKNLTSIGTSAFTGCVNLIDVFNMSNLDIVKDKEGYGDIAIYATNVYGPAKTDEILYSTIDENGLIFYDNKDNYILRGIDKSFQPTSLILPDGFNGKSYFIANNAFENNATITSLVVGNNVNSIGDSAFLGCRNLESVVISDSITVLGKSVFASCTNLKEVTLGNGLTTIPDNTFSNCRSLESVVIPDSIKTIGNRAFYNCDSLKSVTIPNSVTSMASSVFNDCYSLKSVVISDNVTSIESFTFYNCDSLTSVKIGNGVTNIGDYVFSGCSNLISIVIPDSVEVIGNSVFGLCYNLKSIVIPDSVEALGSSVFYHCDSLTNITFSDTTYWYVTIDYTNWQNKTGGTKVDVTYSEINDDYATSTYKDYYWYKL